MNFPGIYLAALMTSLVAFALAIVVIRRAPQADRGRLWLAALVTLPMQPLAFYLVRLPLNGLFVSLLGSGNEVYEWLTTLYAPLTEEPAKLVPLLIPVILRDICPTNFVRYSLTIGISFAIGEMWFIANQIARQPEFAAVPFYEFLGYGIERLMTCVFHTAFVAITLSQLNRHLLIGFAGAVVAHWLGNFPIFLMAWNVGGLGKEAWMALVQIWIVVSFLGALVLLSYFSFGRVSPARWFYGTRHCPGCEVDYEPPLLFAINFGPIRYERCPHCGHWHWTGPARQSS